MISSFGPTIKEEKKITPAETDYFFYFDKYQLTLAHLNRQPQMVMFRSSDNLKELKFKNLTILPGESLNSLSLPFQEFAKLYNSLPEFGILAYENITNNTEGRSKIRIIYDLETELIREVLLINSAL